MTLIERQVHLLNLKQAIIDKIQLLRTQAARAEQCNESCGISITLKRRDDDDYELVDICHE